ncbi:MAG: NAD(P)H-dependent oxidoreductase [Anaerolineae bacterium]|nr:NAD(P)H-dependent oxidoreductase [Anaerolineae bacterium]
MHVVAISGSMRSTSTNSALVRAAAALAPDDMTVTIYEGLGELPHFSPDLDSDPAPESVQRLREQLHIADAILICTPEYAYGMPGSLKNMLDWTVSSGEFYNKPVAALSASPSQGGGERAQASLLLTLTALSANVAEGAKLTVPLVRTKLDADGRLIDPATGDALRSVLAALAETVRQPT